MYRHAGLATSVLLTILLLPRAGAQDFASHPPMRPLASPSARAPAEEPAYYVDAAEGDDTATGAENAPWLTLSHALSRLDPGDTLVLGGGVYHENVTVNVSGTPEKPITIRSQVGELAILDGGFPEFFQKPASAWEPAPDGTAGEYLSVSMLPELAEAADPRWPIIGSGVHSGNVKAIGNFADSMVPLHGYAFGIDLRSTNELWHLVSNKTEDGTSIYCGPGIWFNPDTQRIHCRLAHTRLKVWGENNYAGETDPRKVPMVIAGTRPVLDISGVAHLRFQDLVLRGTRSHTVSIDDTDDIVFDHVTVYGGAPALYVKESRNLTLRNCALRGLCAPWSSRSSEKYRGISSYLFIADGSMPQNQDFEFVNCEFTDNHDGLIIGTINNLDFHHNRVDNFNDDGLYLTLWGKPGKNIRIHENLISRCLTTFSYAGDGKGQENTEVAVYRNIIDLRGPVPYGMPKTIDQPELESHGRTCGDHGGPFWKPMFFYHNTVITADPAYRSYYGLGLGGHMQGTLRRIFNNIFVQTAGLPGLYIDAGVDLQADGNLHWSASDGPGYEGDFFAKFRLSKAVVASKTQTSPGLGVHDLFADPGFASFSSAWTNAVDLTLQADSPAIDAGVAIPRDWPDPLRAQDSGKLDIGAVPTGAQPWRVGVEGRIVVCPLPAESAESGE